MTEKRAMELLNGVINYVAVAADTAEQIETLTRMGFENEDLLYFGYSASDVEEFTKNNIDKTA